MAVDLDTYRILLQGSFQCARCGTCCKICDPISVDEEDIKALAKHFKIPYNRAIHKNTRPHPEVPFLRALKHTNPCKFYDRTTHECKIYDARPKMCRVYPFMNPQQQTLPGIGIYDDCPGMLLTLEVFRQLNEHYSKELHKYREYLSVHPEVEELLIELIQYASAHTIFDEDNIEAGKCIGEKLSPHLAALRAIA